MMRPGFALTPPSPLKRTVFLLGALVSLGQPALAAEVQKHHFDGKQLVLTTDEGTVTLTGYGDGALGVHYQNTGVKQLPSYAIDPGAPVVKGELVKSGEALEYRLADLTARIELSPLALSYYHDGELVVAEEAGHFAHDTLRGFRFALQESEQLMGGGSRVLGMDRRGERMPLYNRAAYGYEGKPGDRVDQMYYGLSAVLSSHHYALVFDNAASGYLDTGATEPDVLQFEAQGGRTAYLVAAGADYGEVIEHLTEATGRQPLPPRWSLGNFASRFGYHSEAEAREVVAKFAEADIPLDAIVLDLYWFGEDVKGHMGNLDWDRQHWPKAEQMIQDFSEQGVNTVLITEPFILTTSNKWKEATEARALATNLAGEPKRFDFYFGNTGLVDVFSEAGRDWFWRQYARIAESGAAGWWGDLGEPEVHPHDAVHRVARDGAEAITATANEVHNAYGHEWARLVDEGLRQLQPDRRPMIMMRSGFVGSQRYGMVPWSGDVARSWGGLMPQVELSLQMGVLGMGYMHSDLGGFAGGEQFDAELYTRWLQYGVFQPVFRPHAQEEIAPEPVFHDADTLARAREAIRLRYALMPYLYTLAYENSTTGMPLMRPLAFEDSALFEEAHSYLWGDAFLVTPVLAAGATEVSVPLPDGVWFDFFTGKRYQGGQRVLVPVTLDTLPVLVQAGSVVPMVAPVATHRYSSGELALHYYHDDSVVRGGGRVYEDDGISPDSLARQAYELLSFEVDSDQEEMRVRLGKQGLGYEGAPKQRRITLTLHGMNELPNSAHLAGNTVAVKAVESGLQLTFDWDGSAQELSLTW
ncbi:TIM-barrel domain-containing protein [Ferrimonas gelatinilytica]|uniref:Glycoside hydrolase family 31 protein n=1 Tax=Ferrimonas gelatinilytica TaxID=1255257 RepID=A0ABP9RUB6_9GAMM